MAGGPDEVTAVTATLIVPVAAFRVVSPEYWATMLLAPTWSCAAPTVMLADADDPVPLSDATPICLPPEVNVDVADDAGNRAYTGPAFTSGAHVYRILYRTTRGNNADPTKSLPGY